MKFSLFFLVALVLYCAALIPSNGHGDTEPLVIFVNTSHADEEITVAEVRRLFLKERTNWKNGDNVVPINAKQGTTARRLFQEKVLNMTSSEEKTYWQKQKISLGITPPPEFSNVQKAVFSLKGSISYCLKSEYKKGTSKIILMLP